MSFLKDSKGNKSMLRLGFIGIHLMALLIVMAICVAIIIRYTPDYSGMAALIGALSLLLGVAYAGKVKQKQTEDSNEDV